MITIILALIEAIWKKEYCELFLGTVIIDVILISAIVAIVKMIVEK